MLIKYAKHTLERDLNSSSSQQFKRVQTHRRQERDYATLKEACRAKAVIKFQTFIDLLLFLSSSSSSSVLNK